MPREHEEHFRALGSYVHLVHEDPDALQEARFFLEEFEDTLSRFRPASELSLLNENENEVVEVSPLMYRAVETALWSAEFSEGIVDPTLLSDIKKAGYQTSWNEQEALPFEELLRLSPRTPPASSGEGWKKLEILDDSVRRPPGTEIDLGGTGKGLAADLLAERWQNYGTWSINLGGDIRTAGIFPRDLQINSPFGEAAQLQISEGALATSAVYRRAWLRHGVPYNHLLDPSSGQPVWGDFLQATAFAQTACEAETRARLALLRNDPEPLREKGGLLLDWQGEWKRIG